MEISIEVVGGGNGDDVGDVLARYSLDVSAGCGGRHSTLLDEYERLAFEAQLNSAILRRCYSEPSPVRFVQPSAGVSPVMPTDQGRAGGEAGWRDEPAVDGRSWRLLGVVAKWLEMLKTVFCLLGSAWEWRRRKEQDRPRGPPATVPRVQLLDYFC
uniref:Uncharacterized protein n=1 Tax=Avena sativa TaxID=4498 RepID=A0ACD5U2T9_AVESA